MRKKKEKKLSQSLHKAKLKVYHIHLATDLKIAIRCFFFPTFSLINLASGDHKIHRKPRPRKHERREL